LEWRLVLKPIRFRRRRPFLDAISRAGNGPGVDDRWHGQGELIRRFIVRPAASWRAHTLFSMHLHRDSITYREFQLTGTARNRTPATSSFVYLGVLRGSRLLVDRKETRKTQLLIAQHRSASARPLM